MSGAESSSGTTEAEINLKIALKLQNLLEQSGSTVILTRSDENSIHEIDSKTIREKKISDIHNHFSRHVSWLASGKTQSVHPLLPYSGYNL